MKHRCYRGSRLQTMLCVLSTRLHRALKTYSRLHYITLTDFNRQKLLALKQIPPENVSVKPNFVEPPETIVPYAAREIRWCTSVGWMRSRAFGCCWKRGRATSVQAGA